MEKEIDIQNENIKNLIELSQENPELRILPMVDTECVASDEFGWWVSQFGSVSIDRIYAKDERMYIRSDDEEELVNSVIDNTNWDKSLTDDEIYIKAVKIVANYEWEKVILVAINPN